MYLGTMWSYLSGFAAVVYLSAPVIYLTFGVLPVQALQRRLLRAARALPGRQPALFLVVGDGRADLAGPAVLHGPLPDVDPSVHHRRGRTSSCGRPLGFAVTPKERQDVESPPWHLVRPQLTAMALLVLASGVGLVRAALGAAGWSARPSTSAGSPSTWPCCP